MNESTNAKRLGRHTLVGLAAYLEVDPRTLEAALLAACTFHSAARDQSCKMSCGCENGQHEPDCHEHPVNRNPQRRPIWP